MKSDRMSNGLYALKTHSYVEALTEFEAAKNTHKTPPENINYYLAITRLGLLLNSHREESKAQSETSIFQQLAAKKSEFKDSKSEKSPSHRTDNISEEIASILAVFQSAKKE